MVGAVVGLAVAATWIAFGDGPRHFVLPVIAWGSWAEGIGRAGFGLGALLAWLIAVLMARAGAKKIFSKKNSMR